MSLDQSPEYQSLLSAIRKERLQKTFLSLIGLSIGSGFLYYSWSSSGKSQTALAVVSLIILVLSLLLASHTIRYWKTNRHPLIFALRHKPQSIVWVYSYLRQHHPFGIALFNACTLIIHKTNGKEISIRIPEDKLKGIKLMLNDLLPHASFGFSEEKKQWYSMNPMMLYRDQESP